MDKSGPLNGTTIFISSGEICFHLLKRDLLTQQNSLMSACEITNCKTFSPFLTEHCCIKSDPRRKGSYLPINALPDLFEVFEVL